MKPTPEQVEAAKAWTKCDESSRQHALLLGSHTHDSMGRIAAEILLAALEAAEAKVEAMASRESASVSKEIETSADMLAQVQNAEARVKELEERLKGTLQAGGYQYFCEQLHAAEREACNARYVAEQLKKKLEASEVDGARLDWLQLYLSDFTKNVSGPTSGGPGWEFGYNAGLGYMVDGCGDTLREAIDAARKEART